MSAVNNLILLLLMQGGPDFVVLKDAVPTVQLDLRYAGEENFVGGKVDGYEHAVCMISRPAALALKRVQEQLSPFGLGLKVFDAYRPQRAVNHFMRWAKDLEDTKTKNRYYPGVEKKNLFKEGYIAEKSGHSRGSTVDLTLVDLATGEELPMGSPFDFFGPVSWVEAKDLLPQYRANRLLLNRVMAQAGFKSYSQEWWHFTLVNEPYPETYFDIPMVREVELQNKPIK